MPDRGDRINRVTTGEFEYLRRVKKQLGHFFIDARDLVPWNVVFLEVIDDDNELSWINGRSDVSDEIAQELLQAVRALAERLAEVGFEA